MSKTYNSITNQKTQFKKNKEEWLIQAIDSLQDKNVKFSIEVLEFIFKKLIENIDCKKFPSFLEIEKNGKFYKDIIPARTIAEFNIERIEDQFGLVSILDFRKFILQTLINIPHSLDNLNDFYKDTLKIDSTLQEYAIKWLIRKNEYKLEDIKKFAQEIEIHDPILSEKNTEYFSIKINKNQIALLTNQDINFYQFYDNLHYSIVKFIKLNIVENIQSIPQIKDNSTTTISFIVNGHNESQRDKIYMLLNSIKANMIEVIQFNEKKDFEKFFFERTLNKSLKNTPAIPSRAKI